MSRFARTRRVFFFEEPVFENTPQPYLKTSICSQTGVHVITPVLPANLDRNETIALQKRLLESLIAEYKISRSILWYYTPMARDFTSAVTAAVKIYDCMDELSCFAGAPPALRENELELFREVDLVFTGGATLFASKRKQHSAVYLFPSSIDAAHFSRAKTATLEPEDQRNLPGPRLGYAGVIDERMDLDLIRHIAENRPHWQLVMLGPVVKIDESSLPKAPNIHYLGMKSYADLPAYFSGWQIGMLPFALNESTRFISPTKTPEYLAAGLQVVSTPIRDVVSPYGDMGLVGIAHSPEEYVRVVEGLLTKQPAPEFRTRVDDFLSRSSWDSTWSKMNDLVNGTLAAEIPKPLHLSNVDRGGIAHV